MDMQQVNSGLIQAIGYDPTSRKLQVQFKSGQTYDFCGVPQHLYEQFMNSSSKITFYNNYIKNRYQC